MRATLLGLAAATVLATGAFAQTAPGAGVGAGATTGAIGGAIVGGPVGAAIGAGVGAVVGGLSEQQQPQFRSYVVQQNVPSYRYQQEVQVGAVLPESGVRYYEVPEQFGARQYRYTVVNETPVLVDPGTRRIVQVIR